MFDFILIYISARRSVRDISTRSLMRRTLGDIFINHLDCSIVEQFVSPFAVGYSSRCSISRMTRQLLRKILRTAAIRDVGHLSPPNDVQGSNREISTRKGLEW